MFQVFRRIPATSVAYVLLLFAFVSLGTFVAALSLGSSLATVAAAALIVSVTGAVAGFRAGARRLADGREPGASAHNVSIFSTPLRRDEVDRYLQSYRDAATETAPAVRQITVVQGGRAEDVEHRAA